MLVTSRDPGKLELNSNQTISILKCQAGGGNKGQHKMFFRWMRVLIFWLKGKFIHSISLILITSTDGVLLILRSWENLLICPGLHSWEFMWAAGGFANQLRLKICALSYHKLLCKTNCSEGVVPALSRSQWGLFFFLIYWKECCKSPDWMCSQTHLRN